jgi:hypothetical protein
MRRILISAIVLVLLGTASSPYSGETDIDLLFNGNTGNRKVFEIGEELVYNVRYGFISLGKITVTITGVKETSNGPLYQATADIASYSGVPFVSLHHIYSTEMNPSFYSMWFQSLEKNKDRWDLMRLHFDYDHMKVLVEEGLIGNEELTDTLEIDNYFQDGLSLFYFARGFIGTDENLTIPTLVNKDVVTTDFIFNGERTSRKSKVVDYPVEVIELTGRANFSGVFGMTGAFRGWFSNDYASIPIEAKLRVLIGNVTVELIEWSRSGWTPPKYANDR